MEKCINTFDNNKGKPCHNAVALWLFPIDSNSNVISIAGRHKHPVTPKSMIQDIESNIDRMKRKKRFWSRGVLSKVRESRKVRGVDYCRSEKKILLRCNGRWRGGLEWLCRRLRCSPCLLDKIAWSWSKNFTQTNVKEEWSTGRVDFQHLARYPNSEDVQRVHGAQILLQKSLWNVLPLASSKSSSTTDGNKKCSDYSTRMENL